MHILTKLCVHGGVVPTSPQWLDEGIMTQAEPLSVQIARLRQHMPQLQRLPNLDCFKNRDLPFGADGLYAFPNWRRLGMSYEDACTTLSYALRREYKEAFTWSVTDNIPLRDGLPQFEGKLVAMDPNGDTAMERAVSWQLHADIVVLPARILQPQTENLEIVRRRLGVWVGGGVGYFHALSVLLTHPKLLCGENEPPIYCMHEVYQGSASRGFPVVKPTEHGITVSIEVTHRDPSEYRPAYWLNPRL